MTVSNHHDRPAPTAQLTLSFLLRDPRSQLSQIVSRKAYTALLRGTTPIAVAYPLSLEPGLSLEGETMIDLKVFIAAAGILISEVESLGQTFTITIAGDPYVRIMPIDVASYFRDLDRIQPHRTAPRVAVTPSLQHQIQRALQETAPPQHGLIHRIRRFKRLKRFF